jgi:N-methylhydantoinase B
VATTLTTAASDSKWDGTVDGYWPPNGPLDPMPLAYWPRGSEPDPVTFEVIRHRLFRVVEEQGLTIMKVSGSPVATFAHDFSSSLLTPEGEPVYFGPWCQPQMGHLDRNVKWILTHRSERPGIHDGDMFLGNDPWIGTNHQSDINVLCPVFVEDKLLCWVASVMHVSDVGGSTPGGFCPDARNVYDEPMPTPLHTYVEKGEVRPDAEDSLLRRSRLPDQLRLDVRALIASNNVACERLLELVKRYDVETVAGSMRRIIDDSERAFKQRIAELPDGTWSRESYLDIASPGDRGLYPVKLRLVKEGEHLTFDHEGTHPQIGSLNTTAGAWRSAVLAAVNPLLCWDLMYAIGGPMRQVHFEPVPGSIVTASHPAAVSNSAVAIPLTIALATACISKMMAACAVPQLRRRAMAAAAGTYPVSIFSGVDASGDPFATMALDPMGGGLGAFSFRDGANTGGHLWDPVSTMPNVEFTEQYFPILYLYRREATDSGGAGYFRGGNSGVFAVTPHGVPAVTVDVSAAGWAVPTSEGLFGGQPGCPNGARVAKGAEVGAAMASGSVPQALEETEATISPVPPKLRDLELREGDIFELWWNAGGGFGDPLARDPEMVVADVALNAVSVDHARRVYGVVVSDGVLDEAATKLMRQQLGLTIDEPHELLAGPSRDASGALRCPSCGSDVGELDSAGETQGTIVRELPLGEISPLAAPAKLFVDAEVRFRTHACAKCGRAVEGRVVASEKGVD